MDLSPISNLYVNHPKDRARTDDLWDKFCYSKEFDRREISDNYGSLLLTDWTRCKEMGVDPGMQQVPVVSGDAFQRLIESRKFLIESATPILEKIRQAFVEVPGLILFADQEGTLLQVLGDSRMKLRAENRCNIVEGGRWNESDAGTNGIGTPIAKKLPVHLCASEHFCEAWHMWTCAGAPILDPFTGEVVGVIDFTTHERDYRESAIVLSYSLAVNITSELRCKRELERIHLIHQHDLCASRFPYDDVVVLDRMGSVVRTSEKSDPESAKPVLRGGASAEGVKEVRTICAPGSETPIGTLVVTRRNRHGPHIFQADPLSHKTVTFGTFLTCDPRTKQLMERIGKVARSDVGVLLVGETGTGKEVIANYIHGESKRQTGAYIAVNCGAINKELFESTFFGYERGAFTGADSRGRKGLFESSNGGTLFLDEIGEMPLDIQAGLLRVLETRTFRRVGSDRELSTDCRVIAATNRPLSDRVAEGTFRSDLYYRLTVVKFDVPPLRERPGDIPALVDYFLKAACHKHGFPPKGITPDALNALAEHPWPGNVRELRNVIESACVFSDDLIDLKDLPMDMDELSVWSGSIGRPRNDVGSAGTLSDDLIDRKALPPETIEDRTREALAGQKSGQATEEGNNPLNDEAKRIVEALRKYKKVIRVAKALGMSRATLYRRFEALGINHHLAARSARY